MKSIHNLLALAVFLTISPHPYAAEPAGKPQHITSPGQVPDGLAKSDWTVYPEI